MIMSNDETENKHRRALLLGYLSIACLSLIIIIFSTYSMNKVRKESGIISQKILTAKIFSLEILTSLINQQTGIRETPLNIISAATQLLSVYCESGSLDNPKNLTYKHLGSIRKNSYRLSKLINNIIDLSKI